MTALTPEQRARLVEVIAEAIWQAESHRVDRGPRRVSWAEVGDPTWRTYRALAPLVIAAAERAGFRWEAPSG